MQTTHFKIKRSSVSGFTEKIFNVLILGLLLLFLNACGVESNVPDSYNASDNSPGARQPGAVTETEPGTGIVPQGGNWVANQINFDVSADGTLVEQFEVTYAGRASNENCDFDYSDVVTVSDVAIEDGTFIYDSGEVVIEGRFITPQEAEVTVLWFGYYGGGCQVDYNGELMEVASVDVASTE